MAVPGGRHNGRVTGGAAGHGGGTEPDVAALFDVARDGVVLRVVVQPGAGGDAVVGVHGDALRLRVSAPPVSGRANEAVVSLLAGALGVAPGLLQITSGATGRRKRVKVRGLDPTEARRRLGGLLGPGHRGT